MAVSQAVWCNWGRHKIWQYTKAYLESINQLSIINDITRSAHHWRAVSRLRATTCDCLAQRLLLLLLLLHRHPVVPHHNPPRRQVTTYFITGLKLWLIRTRSPHWAVSAEYVIHTYTHVVYFRHNRSIEVKKTIHKHAKLRNKRKRQWP